ncbi:HAMP domain-containing histidine kinase [Rhizobium cremeum]|uniref:sensor histidine kinase n=1 Tax=Rhizobium cremeum TaxID=2813827 RepID=UPI000DD5D5D5|nr:HAMP domain-containing sensor histidine kinase [Rhizobium cremeum]MCJ7993660.1 HAMP domain-containing histidine kinase [Rhizobium cremeum]MCJ7998717.1 HAMP domain-containing histidine kinase [Rhizobium cremeum]
MMQSIRGRFLLVSLVSVVLALAMASVVLVSLFTRNLETRIDHELTGHIDNIAGALRFAADGALLLPERPVDRRFEEAYGGLYWQVEDDARKGELRSASLWDYSLPLPDDEQETGNIHRYRLPGPEGTDLIVQERKIIFAAPDGRRAIRVAAAIDGAVVADARRAFAFDIIPYMVALAVFLIAASLAQLTYGLRPISSVSEGLDRIRERKAERLTGAFPRELRGVVAAVNQLLDAQSRLIDKAKARAADLAHGLKTPLTVLSNDAETLRQRGETEIADELSHLAGVMKAHVEHELTRSRIAASAELRKSDADLAASLGVIVRTLKRTPRGEALDWNIAVAPGIAVGVDPLDLQEMLGNILDNAVKWGRSRIRVMSASRDGRPVLTIEDDGPGADPAGLRTIMQRGTRLDLKTPGTGIGLAIVRDIADVYGLDIEAENVAAGGFRVTIRF